MAKTFKCKSVDGGDCPWRMVARDDEEDLIVETTLVHAKTHHPEFAADSSAPDQIRDRISDLLRQSKYFEQDQ